MKTNHLVSLVQPLSWSRQWRPLHIHTLSYLFLSPTFVQPVPSYPFQSLAIGPNSQMLEIPCFFSFFVSFLFVSPLPSVPPSKMGESECFNYYIIHMRTYTGYFVACIQTSLSGHHSAPCAVPCLFLALPYPFTFCFEFLHTFLYLLLHTLSIFPLLCPSPAPPLLLSPTPAFRLKWPTRLEEVWGEKGKESLSPSMNPLRGIGQVLGQHE